MSIWNHSDFLQSLKKLCKYTEKKCTHFVHEKMHFYYTLASKLPSNHL